MESRNLFVRRVWWFEGWNGCEKLVYDNKLFLFGYKNAWHSECPKIGWHEVISNMALLVNCIEAQRNKSAIIFLCHGTKV